MLEEIVEKDLQSIKQSFTDFHVIINVTSTWQGRGLALAAEYDTLQYSVLISHQPIRRALT